MTEGRPIEKGEFGWTEVICGSMFSGKSEELIRRLKRCQFAKQKVVIFKPESDDRGPSEKISSRSGDTISSITIKTSSEAFDHITNEDVIAFDEAQFFDSNLPEVCSTLEDKNYRVIVAGLDMDFKRKPFGPIPTLLAQAKYISKVHAICTGCGDLAQYSYRKMASENLIMIGDINEYEPLCKKCYEKSKS